MNSRKSLHLALAVLTVLLVPCARGDDHPQHQHSATPGEKLGAVQFPVSCNAAAQEEFVRAVAMLHSFWYEEAGKTFAAVTQADPACAMGYWGIAMSYFHPLWEPMSPEALQKGLEAIHKAKAANAKTERERDYIAAIEAYYKDSEKLDHRARALAYEKAMEQVHLRNPQDREAAVFYALALLGTAPPSDKTYANQKKAAALLDQVFAVEPNHPGVTHYFIHAYDSPALAPLALPAARQYAKIAPSVPHALHMPSHIFTRLGLWQDSIQSNLASAAAARDYAARAHLGGAWDQQLHAMDYLAYAYLQGGQDREAKAVMEEMAAMNKFVPGNLTSAYALAAVPARYALERHRWPEAASLGPGPASFPWSRYPWAEATVYFARGLGAARSGRTSEAKEALERIGALHKTLADAKQSYAADQVEILRQELDAWIGHAVAKKEFGRPSDAVTAQVLQAASLETMRGAANLEDATEKHPVTPGPIIPARELLGDLLLELNRPAEALREYESSLRTAPNRFNSLYGAARAAELSGDGGKAKSYLVKLIEICKQSTGDRPELREAKSLLARK